MDNPVELNADDSSTEFKSYELTYIANMLYCAMSKFQDEANGEPQLFGICNPERARRQIASIEKLQKKLLRAAEVLLNNED